MICSSEDRFGFMRPSLSSGRPPASSGEKCGCQVIRSPSPSLRQYNLIYGLNGSGKSTLSRLLSSLQAGESHAKLPEGCSFEVVLDGGATHGRPTNPGGLEQHLLVLNTDYIEQNLKWATGGKEPGFLHRGRPGGCRC